MLAMYVGSDHKNWDDVLPFITYAYNTARHETTGYSPFYLLHARVPRHCIDTILPFSIYDEPSIATTLCRAVEARRIARLRILDSQQRSKHRYDIRHQPISYDPGDRVWLWTPLRKRGLCQKLLSHYTGPFVVLERISDLNYAVSRLTDSGRCSRKIHVVHIARLKRFSPRDTA
ncbi:uncharacterized protein LOC144102459 [Amblyomma americanum]